MTSEVLILRLNISPGRKLMDMDDRVRDEVMGVVWLWCRWAPLVHKELSRKNGYTRKKTHAWKGDIFMFQKRKKGMGAKHN